MEFSRLDDVVREFRVETLPDEVKRMARISKFRTKNEQAFRAAAAELAQTTPDDRTAELLDAFYARVEDEDPSFRRVALQELKHVANPGDLRAIEVALKHVADEDGQAVAAALEALQALAHKGDEEVVAVTVHRLEKLRCSRGHPLQLRVLPPDCICALCQEQRFFNNNEGMRCETCDYSVCGKCDHVKDPCVRMAAMHLLGALAERGDEKAVSLTLQYLEDQDSNVRNAVLESLKTLSDTGSADVLISVCKLLENEKERPVVFKILDVVEIVAGHDCKVGSAELLEHVEHKDADIRKRVLTTLRSAAPKGDANAIKRLSKCLGKEQDTSVVKVIIQVLQALAERGDETAISALLQTLERKAQRHDGQEDYTVRNAAIEALTSLVNESDERVCVSLLQLLEHGDSHVRDAAVEALKSVVHVGDEEMCRQLLQRFEHSDPRVRNKAMEALQSLAHKGDAPVCSTLLQLLQHEDDSVCVLAGEALRSLATSGNAHVRNTLMNLIQHSDKLWTRYSALVAIETAAEQGDENVISAISMCLQDQAGAVREAAEKVLQALQ